MKKEKAFVRGLIKIL